MAKLAELQLQNTQTSDESVDQARKISDQNRDVQEKETKKQFIHQEKKDARARRESASKFEKKLRLESDQKRSEVFHKQSKVTKENHLKNAQRRRAEQNMQSKMTAIQNKEKAQLDKFRHTHLAEAAEKQRIAEQEKADFLRKVQSERAEKDQQALQFAQDAKNHFEEEMQLRQKENAQFSADKAKELTTKNGLADKARKAAEFAARKNLAEQAAGEEKAKADRNAAWNKASAQEASEKEQSRKDNDLQLNRLQSTEQSQKQKAKEAFDQTRSQVATQESALKAQQQQELAAQSLATQNSLASENAAQLSQLQAAQQAAKSQLADQASQVQQSQQANAVAAQAASANAVDAKSAYDKLMQSLQQNQISQAQAIAAQLALRSATDAQSVQAAQAQQKLVQDEVQSKAQFEQKQSDANKLYVKQLQEMQAKQQEKNSALKNQFDEMNARIRQKEAESRAEEVKREQALRQEQQDFVSLRQQLATTAAIEAAKIQQESIALKENLRAAELSRIEKFNAEKAIEEKQKTEQGEKLERKAAIAKDSQKMQLQQEIEQEKSIKEAKKREMQQQREKTIAELQEKNRSILQKSQIKEKEKSQESSLRIYRLQLISARRRLAEFRVREKIHFEEAALQIATDLRKVDVKAKFDSQKIHENAKSKETALQAKATFLDEQISALRAHPTDSSSRQLASLLASEVRVKFELRKNSQHADQSQLAVDSRKRHKIAQYRAKERLLKSQYRMSFSIETQQEQLAVSSVHCQEHVEKEESEKQEKVASFRQRRHRTVHRRWAHFQGQRKKENASKQGKRKHLKNQAERENRPELFLQLAQEAVVKAELKSTWTQSHTEKEKFMESRTDSRLQSLVESHQLWSNNLNKRCDLKNRILSQLIKFAEIRKQTQLENAKKTSAWLAQERASFETRQTSQEKFFNQRDDKLHAEDSGVRVLTQEFEDKKKSLLTHSADAAQARKKNFDDKLKSQHEAFQHQKAVQEEELKAEASKMQTESDAETLQQSVLKQQRLQSLAQKNSEAYLARIQSISQEYAASEAEAASEASAELAEAEEEFATGKAKLEKKNLQVIEQWDSKTTEFLKQEHEDTIAARQRRLVWWRKQAAAQHAQKTTQRHAHFKLIMQWWNRLVQFDRRRIKLVDRGMVQMRKWTDDFLQVRKQRYDAYESWARAFKYQQATKYQELANTLPLEDTQRIQTVMIREEQKKETARRRMLDHFKSAEKSTRAAMDRRLAQFQFQRKKISKILQYESNHLTQIQAVTTKEDSQEAQENVDIDAATNKPVPFHEDWWRTGFNMNRNANDLNKFWTESTQASHDQEIEKRQKLFDVHEDAAERQEQRVQEALQALSSVPIPPGTPPLSVDSKVALSELGRLQVVPSQSKQALVPISTTQTVLPSNAPPATLSIEDEVMETKGNLSQGFVFIPRSVISSTGYNVSFSIYPIHQINVMASIVHHGAAERDPSPSIAFAQSSTRLKIRAVTVNKGTFEVLLGSNLILNAWSQVSIVHDETGRLKAWINGDLVYDDVVGAPIANNGPVYMSSPWSAPANANIKDLDFTPLAPLPGVPVSAGYQWNSTSVSTPNGFIASFSLFPTQVSQDWTSIFHHGESKDENSPAIMFIPGTTRLLCLSGTESNSNNGLNTSHDLPLNKWSTVVIRHDTTGYLTVTINGIAETVSIGAPLSHHSAVYVGDPWHQPAIANIKNIVFVPLAFHKQKLQKRKWIDDLEASSFRVSFALTPRDISRDTRAILVHGNSDSDSSPSIFFKAGTTKMVISVRVGPHGQSVQTEIPLLLDERVALVISCDRKGILRVWVDGVLDVKSNLGEAPYSQSGPVYLGSPSSSFVANAVIENMSFELL